MKHLIFAAMLAAIMMIGACSKDDAADATKAMKDAASGAADQMTEGGKKMMDKAESTASKAADMAADSMSTAAEKVTMAADGATRYIDHAQDDVEFELKRSIAGLESLLEDVKDSEQVAMMQKQLDELQAKLDAM